ncbi:MAG: SIS domain-containing protein [Acidobacteria bacterium]|nr:SIS domain-containing protein [Acidobacteriota bacterium]
MARRGWHGIVAEYAQLLGGLSMRDRRGRELGPDAGLVLWRKLTVALRRKKGTIYLIGNGASASMASHVAADLAKNARIHTEVFSDLSLITAISNDMGYENVFAEPLRRRSRPGDMLVAISSSGRSPNVLSATDLAASRHLTIVTLSAMEPGNPLRSMGDLNAYVAAPTYGKAESCHATILHSWMDLVVIDGAGRASTHLGQPQAERS